ncbi:MAG: hypothetical protein IJZ07_01115 [Clostridia bacterium]|nr:hypothetical protein [Clostridia bacterium]
MLKKGFSLGTVQMLAVFYLVVWTTSPPLEIDLIYRLLALGLAAVWFIIMFIRDNPVVMEKEHLASLFFVLAIILVVYIDTGSFSQIIKQISFFMFTICFIVSCFYRGRWDEIKGIVPVLMVLLIFWNFKTYSVLLEDPTVARLLVRADAATYDYLRQGVGGYSLVYPQVCICPAILAWIIKAFRGNKVYFTIGAVWLVSFVLLIAKAGYSLAIFGAAAGAVILFFYKGKSGIKAFLVSLLIFAAAMLSILYIEDLRNFLLEFFDGTAVAKKINDLVATGESGSAEGSIQLRIDAYLYSLQVAAKYPIVGALWREGNGSHSAVLDVLAKYGLWGAAIFCTIIYSVPNYYKKKYNDVYIRSVANATFVSLMIISTLDAFNYSFSCMILIVLPLLFEDIIKWTGVETDENTLVS